MLLQSVDDFNLFVDAPLSVGSSCWVFALRAMLSNKDVPTRCHCLHTAKVHIAVNQQVD